ncbi:four-carbon acid sugar kinase family protein [Billgrantia antri]|uniref:Four-carbon acid sugar kinase family protein n=1 Tax=Halomonas sulfidivorans TaxID=2733488 RepID=A0ABX7WGC3_9GAMM|nr:four-carbon acid sugar kinase family protein [Halomonas sulfidivorans]QTP58920.1 four-carbon acid sugar kinase family protein [Halomonas sulfidivorans]
MSPTDTAPLIAYYGDDLTGSTDVMEALSSQGVDTVLFTAPPDDAQLARFRHCRAIGLAGTSRSESPAWMDRHLTPALAWLRERGAALCHYKTCSTFDSAPQVGSIGRALEIGRHLHDQGCVPIVVGAPQLRRYTAFGQLFAAAQGEVYRIDRHPIMSRHPVTPMHEADLRRHLAAQTDLDIGLIDLVTLASDELDARVEAARTRHAALLYDVMDSSSQAAVGRQLWRTRVPGGSFIVGSSGVEYALLAEWRRLGLIEATPSAASNNFFSNPGPVERIAVVSGSCSETTARQIRWAAGNGFEGIRVDAARLADDHQADAELDAAREQALAALAAKRSVIVYTALGPDNGLAKLSGEESAHAIGRCLGRLLRDLVSSQGLSRVVVAGGDTSSHAIQELGIQALTTCLPLPQTPGSPLCTAHSNDPAFDGLQIAFKGGQVGDDAYFGRIRDAELG